MPALDFVGDLLGIGGDVPQAEFSPYGITSGVGTSSFADGTGTFELSPELQGIYDQLLGSGSQQLQAAQEYDPYAAAEGLFGRLDQILAPGREQGRQGLESRLLNQGRLGSTGGAFQQQGFESAIEAERARQLNQAFGTAQGVQDSMFNRGMAGIQGALGIQGAGMNQLNLGLQAGQGSLQAGMFNIGNQIQQDQLLPSLITGLGQGALTGWASGGFK